MRDEPAASRIAALLAALAPKAKTLAEIHAAGEALFDARADEARQLGFPARPWPPVVTAHEHWAIDYARAAETASITLPLAEAVAQVNN